MTIRNSNLAKFGTKAERDTELQVYANRRPKLPTGKTTEELINHHAKESRKKLEGGKRMKHRKVADDVSTVSSIHSNVTRALRVRMPTKPKRQLSTAPPNQPTESSNESRGANEITNYRHCHRGATEQAKAKSSYKSISSITSIKMKPLHNIDHRIGWICDFSSNLPSHNLKYWSNWEKKKTTKHQETTNWK